MRVAQSQPTMTVQPGPTRANPRVRPELSVPYLTIAAAIWRGGDQIGRIVRSRHSFLQLRSVSGTRAGTAPARRPRSSPAIRRPSCSPASDWPGTYSFQLMRDDVIALIEQLGLREVLLACHSMGGIVACLVAMTRSDQVA
jgi:hypothetical protein